ncbi:MAG: TonB family protein [Pseudomonadota bacterium]
MAILNSKAQKQQKNIFLLVGGITLVLICVAVFAVKLLVSDDGQKRKKQIQMVTILTPPPPPPPKIKEKLPEPEVVKKEEIVEPKEKEPEPEPVEDQQAKDEPPPGQDLGIDGEGGDGSDGFGLAARKGGRSLIGGSSGGGSRSLMIKYAWYTSLIQEELRKKLNKCFEENGGIPSGNPKAVVQITLSEEGNILACELQNSSGDSHMDHAVQTSFKTAKISEPPPTDMPRTIKLKISARG